MRGTILISCILLALGVGWGTVRLPYLFSDNMVLQRDKPIAVWGWADPGEAVTVTLGAATAKATADAAGAWQVALPALKEGENLELTVAGKNTLTLKNLIMGDVWVCSGQSNMEWTVSGSLNAAAEAKTADLPKIRRIKIEHLLSGYPEENFPRQYSWQVCAPGTVPGFTAVGFFFAREIFQQTGVPIGIIDDNWGGTQIEPWTPLAGAAAVPELAGMVKNMENLTAAYHKQLPAYLEQMEVWSKAARQALAEGKEVPRAPEAPMHPVWAKGDPIRPFTMYNAMIAPFTRGAIKGALWYQGESNGGERDSYYHKMRALIGGWRAAWKQGDFPFYYVQLANFTGDNKNPAGGDGYANIRNAQTKSLSIPNTGMAVIIDIGETGNIHPPNKQDVGSRLARWALNRDYGKKALVPSGPLFKEAKVDGNKIRISFDYVGSGLMVGQKTGLAPTEELKDGALARFAIAGEDKKWVWADAIIEGNTVVVFHLDVPNPVAVRYAYSANPLGANLYNKEGLPAAPFRTDAW
ncbi:MAG: sialate O-acetylesterase [Armatimonadota bacterium]